MKARWLLPLLALYGVVAYGLGQATTKPIPLADQEIKQSLYECTYEKERREVTVATLNERLEACALSRADTRESFAYCVKLLDTASEINARPDPPRKVSKWRPARSRLRRAQPAP